MQMLIKRGSGLPGPPAEFRARQNSRAIGSLPAAFCRPVWERAADDGDIGIPPLTHQVLAQYVGTTREIITFQMNQLRQKGLLRYSRKGIQIYPEALREYLPSWGIRPRLPRISLRSPRPLRKSTYNLGIQPATA